MNLQIGKFDLGNVKLNYVSKQNGPGQDMFYNQLQCGVVTQVEDKMSSQKFLRGPMNKGSF